MARQTLPHPHKETLTHTHIQTLTHTHTHTLSTTPPAQNEKPEKVFKSMQSCGM